MLCYAIKPAVHLPSILFTLLLLCCNLSYAGTPEEDGEAGIEAFEKGDLTTGMQLMEKASQAGYAPAQAQLGFILKQGGYAENALKLFQKAANQNNGAGFFGLSQMYYSGTGTKANLRKSIGLLKRAVAVKHPPAMAFYADMLKTGNKIIEQDIAESLILHKEAAELGSLRSATLLKNFYRDGNKIYNIQPDAAMAEKYRKLRIPKNKYKNQKSNPK